MDPVTHPDDTELLMKATPMGLLYPCVHSSACRVHFVILLVNYRSVPDSVSESGALSLIDSLSKLLLVLSQTTRLSLILNLVWLLFYHFNSHF